MSDTHTTNTLRLASTLRGLTIDVLDDYLQEARRQGAPGANVVRVTTQTFGTPRLEIELPLSTERQVVEEAEPERRTVSSLQVERAAEVIVRHQGTVAYETLALLVVEALGFEVHG